MKLASLTSRIPRPATLIALGAVSAPIGYVVQQHTSWERSPQGKGRMLIHQGLFWGSFGWGVKSFHDAFMKLRRDKVPLKRLLHRFVLAGLLPALAFEYGGAIARWFIPKLPPTPVPAPPKRYVPSFLKIQTGTNIH